jgi:hypothetical protein
MLTAREFVMHEPVPLHRVHTAILEFCRRPDSDAIVFGAQAVNVHLPPNSARMTQDVDILTAHPRKMADSLAAWLRATLFIAARVREVRPGIGYRVYQARADKRHLADVRLLEFEPYTVETRDGVRFVGLPILVGMKIAALGRRGATAKGLTDRADLQRLLLAHPELREGGAVALAISRACGEQAPAALEAWEAMRATPFEADDDDAGY